MVLLVSTLVFVVPPVGKFTGTFRGSACQHGLPGGLQYSRRPLVTERKGSADWPVVVLPFRAWASSGFALPRPFVAIFLCPPGGAL